MNNPQKNILILSWFFPPSTMPAAQRTYAFAKYFNRFGYRPTIVSRKWDEYQNLKDYYKPSETQNIDYLFCRHYDAYLLPYNPKLRDRLANKKGIINTLIRKTLSTIDILIFPLYIKISPYYPLYFFSNELLKKSHFDAIIATGNPFELFKLAKILSKKHNIPYILDYRDDWSTSQLNFNKNITDYFKIFYFRILEKSWSSNCLFFTSVTPFYTSKINKIINRKGIVIYNGYFNFKAKLEVKDFTFIYSGKIYPQQNLNILFEALLLFKSSISNNIKLFFIGNDDDLSIKYSIINTSLKENIFLLKRLNSKEIHQAYCSAFGFLLFSYGEIKGILTTKIFEYLFYKKPILLCPSDNDIMQEMLIKTRTGYYANNVKDCYNHLVFLYSKFIKMEPAIEPNLDEINQYSRKNQIYNFSKALNEYL